MTRDQLLSGRGRRQSPAEATEPARPQNRATNAGTAGHAGTGPHQTCVMVNINMTWYHPKYYAALRAQRRKLTSSQASSVQAPNQRTRVQASSQSAQAPGFDDQGTSAQAHGPGCKQQG